MLREPLFSNKVGRAERPAHFQIMRCYIIGNGIRLSKDQLERIKGQPSIACNRINLIYPETSWRPTVYVHPEALNADIGFIQENVDMGIPCYLGEHFQPDIKPHGNITWIKDCHHHLFNFDSPEVPDEWHLPQLCSFGGSVNVSMQVAVKLGYDELVLLGCDLEYRDRKPSHFHKDYEHGGEQPAFYAARNALYGHIQALNWIRRKNRDSNYASVTVYNATPGGLLEIWERIKI